MTRQDDWYDPRQHRRSGYDDPAWRSPPSRVSNPWFALVFWSAVFAGAIFAASEYLDRKAANQGSKANSVSASLGATIDCPTTHFPTHGTTRVIDPSIMKRSDVTFSGLQFENRHTTAMTATILQGDRKVASILLMPGQSGEMAAPVGNYGLELALGTLWCGGKRDFKDKRSVNVVDGIASHSGQATSTLIESDHTNPAGIRLTNVSKAPAPPLPVAQPSPGEILVSADRLGHFRIPGSVNGRAVTFLVDTGASSVAISRKMAKEAGLYHCTNFGTTSTANGQVDVCVVKNIQIEFGGIRVPSVDLAVLPNMGDEVLLGMSVLKHMTIQQADGRLRLTAR